MSQWPEIDERIDRAVYVLSWLGGIAFALAVAWALA
jgi:hypothetical protein